MAEISPAKQDSVSSSKGAAFSGLELSLNFKFNKANPEPRIQYPKQHRRRPVKYIVLLAIILLVTLVCWAVWSLQGVWYFLITLLILGLIRILYIPCLSQWTGFGAYTSPKSDQYDYQRKKTLWDWFQLLIIPIILTGGGLWFNAQQNKQQTMLAEDQRKETTLKTYMDDMSSLLLDKGLLNSQPDNHVYAVRTVAAAKTQAVLRVLDPQRRSILLRFLGQAQLISSVSEQPPIIPLNDTDLSHADLSNISLSGAELENANLSYTVLSHTILDKASLYKADLSNANLSSSMLNNVDLTNANLTNANLRYDYLENINLSNADLSNADLRDTNLSSDQLRNANLSGAIMPNGLKHPSNTGLPPSSTTLRKLSKLKPFIGSWYGHGRSLTVEGNGHAIYIARAYQWCEDGVKPPCDTMKDNTIQSGIRIEMSFTHVANHIAYGIITDTTIGYTGTTASVKSAASGTIEFTASNYSNILCGPNAPPTMCGA